MTDRELLEMAARAAGIKARWFKVNIWKDGVGARFHVGTKDVFGTHHAKPWNPLTDDGDALRLAVKLKLCIDIHPEGTTVCDYDDVSAIEYCADNEAATRRAIVRAAAAIGAGLAPFPTAEQIREDWT